MTAETSACQLIDKKLEQAGWIMLGTCLGKDEAIRSHGASTGEATSAVTENSSY